MCLTIIGFTTFTTVSADSLEMPTDIGAPKNRINVKLPPRGMTMQQVTEQFGEPTKDYEPVGDPPITRWVYPKFTVHFESEFVIHSVIKK